MKCSMAARSSSGMLKIWRITDPTLGIFWTYSALLENRECHTSPSLRKPVLSGTPAAMSQEQALINKRGKCSFEGIRARADFAHHIAGSDSSLIPYIVKNLDCKLWESGKGVFSRSTFTESRRFCCCSARMKKSSHGCQSVADVQKWRIVGVFTLAAMSAMSNMEHPYRRSCAQM